MPEDGERQTQRVETRLTRIESLLKELKEQLTGIAKKTNRIENRLEEQERKLSNIEEVCKECQNWKEQCDQLKVDNIDIKNKLRKIEEGLDRQEIKKRMNTLEIYGIPKKENEGPMEVVKKIGNKLKINIQETDIEECYRARDFNGREKPITVKFKEQHIRSKLMKAVKEKNLRLGDVNMEPENKKVFVNEALIPKRKRLLYMVKNEARGRNWKAVWTYKGDIFLKMEENGQQIKVNNEEELEILIK